MARAVHTTHRSAVGVTAAMLTAVVVAMGPARAARGQVPVRSDSVARADSVARTARARADSARLAIPDSAARDSIAARQLRAAARGRPSMFDLLTLDRLRFTSIGASLGVALPDQVESTRLYAVHADYGQILRHVHVIFGLSYWTSHYSAEALRGFADAVGGATTGGGTRATIDRIRSTDIALNGDLRWRPPTFARRRRALGFRPWVSAGLGVHMLDTEGAPISDTFVERALDGVSFGVAGGGGFDVQPFKSLQLTAQARYDLFNGAHFASLRAGASYVFDRRVTR